MLTKITLDNFKSFQNTATIDLMKTNYTILPQNVAEDGVLKGCIFVGANASGKSTVILAVRLLLDLLFSERSLNSGFFICLFGKRYSYTLAYEFLVDRQRVCYSFEVDVQKAMISEKLYVNDRLLLERMGQSAKSYIAEEAGVGYDETDVGRDTLFLRTLYFNTKFASNPTLKRWMDGLKKSIYINMFEKQIVSYGDAEVSMERYLSRQGCRTINAFFDAYNFEQTVVYEHRTEGGGYRFVVGDDKEAKYVFFKRNGVTVPIPFQEESLGNQNLLRILPAFLSAIENDSLLLIDEFSSGFHNELETLLVRYFMERSRCAQMLFVSHSTNLLSNSILRPDQEYAVEFRQGVGSSVRRFSSQQPRSAQNVEKMYVSGVFGGLPEYKEVAHEAQ